MNGICIVCDEEFEDGKDGTIIEGFGKVGVCDECHTRANEIGAEEWNQP